MKFWFLIIFPEIQSFYPKPEFTGLLEDPDMVIRAGHMSVLLKTDLQKTWMAPKSRIGLLLSLFMTQCLSMMDGPGLRKLSEWKVFFSLLAHIRGVCAFSDNAFRETFVLLKFNDRPEIVPEGPHGLFPVFITQNLPMMAGSDWQTP